MKILFISDLHCSPIDIIESAIKKSDADVIVSLGDNAEFEIQNIRKWVPKVPFYGVRGNHDTYNLNSSVITNLHLKKVDTTDFISLVGFEGSLNYKPGTYPSCSQEESLSIIQPSLKATILCAHSAPQYINDKNLCNEHTGLSGLTKYIELYQPKYMFHGHIHCVQQTQLMDTKVVCVYGITLLDTETDTIDVILDLKTLEETY